MTHRCESEYQMTGNRPIRRKKVDPQVAHLRGKCAGYARHGREDDLREAQRDLRAALLEQAIRKAVEADPPLTLAQRQRLSSLLLGGIDG